jgi:ribosomal-protein-alanine N-acetyltransferase
MLETPRLIIRPAIIEDAHNLFLLNSDPEVVRYTGDVACSTVLDAQNIIRERMLTQFETHKMGRFTVLLKDGTYVGWCGLKFFPETNEVDLGYRFIKKFWGLGLATESSRASLHYGFENLKLNRIIAKAMPANVGSIKVLQKLKMTFRGYVNDPTDPHSFLLYDMTNSEYKLCADS